MVFIAESFEHCWIFFSAHPTLGEIYKYFPFLSSQFFFN